MQILGRIWASLLHGFHSGARLFEPLSGSFRRRAHFPLSCMNNSISCKYLGVYPICAWCLVARWSDECSSCPTAPIEPAVHPGKIPPVELSSSVPEIIPQCGNNSTRELLALSELALAVVGKEFRAQGIPVVSAYSCKPSSFWAVWVLVQAIVESAPIISSNISI